MRSHHRAHFLDKFVALVLKQRARFGKRLTIIEKDSGSERVKGLF